MTSKNDILLWLEKEEIRLNKRIEESVHTDQESISLSGSLLTIQVLLRLIRTNKVKDALGRKDDYSYGLESSSLYDENNGVIHQWLRAWTGSDLHCIYHNTTNSGEKE